MAGSVNKVILLGSLGAEPEIRRTQDGRAIANLRVATSDSWRDKTTGERKEKTEWTRVAIFSEGLCKIAEQYLHKGSKVYLEGQLQTRKWTNQKGEDQYSTEVVLQGFNCQLVLLDGKPGGQQGGGQASAPSGYGNPNAGPNDMPSGGYGGQSPQGGGFGGGTAGGGRFDKDLDDEIPFVFKEIATPWDTV
jgi:single-strand DNA-binding protein